MSLFLRAEPARSTIYIKSFIESWEMGFGVWGLGLVHIHYLVHSFENTTFCDLRIALFKAFLKTTRWSTVGSASTLHFYGMIGLIITRFHVLYCRKHVVDSDKLSQTLLADWMSYWKNTREVSRNPGSIIKH